MNKEIVVIREAFVDGESVSRLVISVHYTINPQMNLDAARGALWASPLRAADICRRLRALPPPEDDARRGSNTDFRPFGR